MSGIRLFEVNEIQSQDISKNLNKNDFNHFSRERLVPQRYTTNVTKTEQDALSSNDPPCEGKNKSDLCEMEFERVLQND